MTGNFVFWDSQLVSKKGVIRNVVGGTSTVFLYDEKRDVSIPSKHLAPVQPAKQDKVSLFYSDVCTCFLNRTLSLFSTSGNFARETEFFIVFLYLGANKQRKIPRRAHSL